MSAAVYARGASVVLCLAAAVFLILVTISAPTWEKIGFLKAGPLPIRFGVLGHTGTRVGIGYRFNSSALAFDDHNLNTPVVLNLTKTLILHPVAAGLAGLASFFGLCGLTYYHGGTVVMVLLAALATVVCLLAFVLDLVLFGIARNSFRSQGISAQYDNACWLTLAALVALLLGFSTASYGVFARYKKNRQGRVS
ncbi:pali-domain-containing protein [Roridomyces roridus]|uniref:Pali-domain-containing protein n=1 Tax=Roridomyces roridus TaxID=1738132 RepID=A0AAD7FWU7_9AGAR|nr:pali-domain-containing protein [Roridomyces roridus]